MSKIAPEKRKLNKILSKVIQDIITSDLSPHAKIVYFYLMQYDPCYPSYERISEDTYISRASVGRALKELKDAGWVKSKIHGRSSTYKLLKCMKIELPDFLFGADKSQIDTGNKDKLRGASLKLRLKPVSNRDAILELNNLDKKKEKESTDSFGPHSGPESASQEEIKKEFSGLSEILNREL